MYVPGTEAVFKLKTLDKKMQISLFWIDAKNLVFLVGEAVGCIM